MSRMLKKTCEACGKDRKKSKVMYDEHLNPYCKAVHECNANHPNSTVNLIKNGKVITMYDHDEAMEKFAKSNTAQTVKHMIHPITLRLSDVRQALHIEKTCAERGISISDYVRGLIDADMQTVHIEEVAPKPIEKNDESELIF